jgi:hypothetical protein
MIAAALEQLMRGSGVDNPCASYKLSYQFQPKMILLLIVALIKI